MASDLPTPVEAARQVVDWDPNSETRSQTEQVLERGDEEELKKLFGSRLTFGTAGLRGPMGCGTNRMNDLTVLQAAQGLCAYVEAEFGDEGKARGIVVGYDHRRHESLNSERFGLLTAEVFMSKGFTVHLYSTLVATPLVPWAIDSLGAVAGVMVTASHNPKADNGYKVYWANGCQIISPHDKGIAAAIKANLAPWDKDAYAGVTPDSVRSNSLCKDPEAEKAKYLEKVAALCRRRSENGSNRPVCYTAMHGVGTPFVTESFKAFGLPAFVPTVEQVEADPEFPTVEFPNPEEGKGALALAMKAADEGGASLILANDPDADRLAVAEKNGDEWTIFTGNEIAALLAHWEWNAWRAANPEADASNVYMVASTVSSKMLGAMAAKEGFKFVETLTGFKYMGNRTADLRAEGKTVLFSFEEAIGFCIGDVVKDKDGVAAASVFAEMAGDLARRGLTVLEQLRVLYDTYGHFLTNNRYLFVDDPSKNSVICDRLRNGGHYWLTVGRWRITAVRDLTTPGFDTEAPDLKPTLPTSSSNMLTYKFSNGAVATLRTSGTEPKLKYYVELSGPDPEATRRELDELVEAIIEEMLEPEKNGLKRPTD